MGAKYEIRWAINNACPMFHSKWTNSLAVALITYAKAVLCGNTNAVLVMHEWRNCPNNCKDFKYCPVNEVG